MELTGYGEERQDRVLDVLRTLKEMLDEQEYTARAREVASTIMLLDGSWDDYPVATIGEAALNAPFRPRGT